MNTILEEVKKLPVAERADLFLALRDDSEMNDYLNTEGTDKVLFNEIAKRDAAYKGGTLSVTTIVELARLLNTRRNAL